MMYCARLEQNDRGMSTASGQDEPQKERIEGELQTTMNLPMKSAPELLSMTYDHYAVEREYERSPSKRQRYRRPCFL